ncbi:aluminum-activated malate transporter 14-like [Dorcoceras hygrometricum]|uniref:Aluminum-activated malate transporter 14-like n=1 Tax=Dorcoceras hygrometricum TaxID=472368 RepID=A0A2Z7AXZ1_9LAMI|nr:aluminum-activated malate transporter 14-like [Dorcoceras hygrometricum]
MVKRKATEAVDMELQERTFETNHVTSELDEEFTNLAKKRKWDPKFSGFGSLQLSGFVQPLQQQANIMDVLKSLQSDMLIVKSIVEDKRAWSPVITTGGYHGFSAGRGVDPAGNAPGGR